MEVKKGVKTLESKFEKMRHFLLSIVFCSILSIGLQANKVWAIYENQIPAPFSESKLEAKHDSVHIVENLGSILKLDTLMSSKTVGSTKFSLHNRHRRTEHTYSPNKVCFNNRCYGMFHYDLDKLLESKFNASARTVIMISGFMTSDYVDWMESTKDTWIRLDPDVNVILVTWKDSNRYIYSRAVSLTPLVARQITIFLYYLAELNKLHVASAEFANKIHIVGHSLGAHIAGFVGQDLGGQVGRISGLDPAGPSFDLMPKSHKLDQTDALLVDVIHTNAGKMSYLNAVASATLTATEAIANKVPLLRTLANLISQDYSGEGNTAWFGIDAQIGHIDYYANSGRVQPGCSGLLHTCDHGRSHQIYEDILKHELYLREQSLNKSWLKENRLLAFKSRNYLNFTTGGSFNVNCPNLLNEHGNQIERVSTFRHCSVPIDFITPPGELIEELKIKHNINFDKFDPTPAPRFYFKTHSERPLVGDHYLLKLFLDRDSFWDRTCALRAEIYMADGTVNVLDLNKEFSLVDGENFLGIAMPFINPKGAKARDTLNKSLFEGLKSIGSSVAQLDWSIVHNVSRVMPMEINLSIVRAESTSVMEAAKNKLVKFISLGKAGKASSNCKLSIVSVEVHPIVGSNRNIAGLFGSDREVAGQRSLRLLTPGEHANRVLEQYRSRFELHALTNPSLTQKLYGIVVE